MRSINAFSIISMEQAYWERHSEERKLDASGYLSDGSNYYGEGRFVGINQSIDSFLRRIFGNFHWEGPRNWIGWTYEGAWTKIGDLDQFLTILCGVFFTFLVGLYFILPLFKDVWLGYIILTIWAAFVILPNKISPERAFFEYIGTSLINIKHNLKIMLLILSGWLVIYLLLVTVIFSQQILNISLIFSLPLNFMIFPILETLCFSVAILPSFTKYFGIIGGLLSTSAFRAIIHLLIFQANPSHMFMSFLFGMMFGWVTLAYKNNIFEFTGHPLANIIAAIINAIKSLT